MLPTQISSDLKHFSLVKGHATFLFIFLASKCLCGSFFFTYTIRNLQGHFSSTMTCCRNVTDAQTFNGLRLTEEETMEGRCEKSHSLHWYLHQGVITVQVLTNTNGCVITS